MSDSPSDVLSHPLGKSYVQVDGALEIKHPAPPAAEPGGKDFWDKLSALSLFLSGVLVAVVGYYLTDSVNVALKRDEIQLSNVTEMRALLLSLQGQNPEDWQAAAFTLSAFGSPAVPPLITALTVADEVRSPYIESALRGIGLSHPESVCAPMTAVLDTHTGRFSWLMHKAAIRMIGDLQCGEALSALRRYADIVHAARTSSDSAAYMEIVDRSVPLSALALSRLDEDLKRTLRIVAPR